MNSFEPSRPGDAPSLLEMIEAEPARGSIGMLYTRRPDPLLSYRQEAEEVSLGVIRGKDGAPCLVEATVYRQYYLNGRAVRAGYIGGVKRRRGVWPRCNWMRALYDFEAPKCNDFYCSVLEGNGEAQRLLTKNRRYMPPFAPVCPYTTFLLNPKALRRLGPGEALAPAAPGDMPRLLEFLNREGRRHNYYPVVTDIARQFSGAGPQDMLLLQEGAEILGFGLLWNQAHYRQNIITGYGGALRYLQKLSPLVTALGYVPMPPPGARADFCVLGLLTVKNDDPQLYARLLAALGRAARARGLQTLVAGAAHGAPLHKALARPRSLRFDSQIFAMQRQPDPLTRPNEAAPVHLEVGWL